MVTTKSGRSGKIEISLDAKYGVNSRGVSAYETVQDPASYYEMMWEAVRNSLYYGGTMGLAQANMSAASSLISGYGLYNIFQGVGNC